MSGNKTTNITQTGLGDDQFKKLQTNQKGLGTQIEEGFDGAQKEFDAVNKGITGLGKDITGLGTSINENTNTGFTTLSDLLSSYGDTLSQGQTDAAAGRKTYYDNMLKALETNTGGLQSSIDGNFEAVTGRFDDLDQSASDLQTSVDTGFEDAQADRTQMQEDINTAFSDQNTGLGEAFTGLGEDIGTAFDTTNTNIADAQSAIQDGQAGMGETLDSLGETVDTYGTSLVEGQEAMQTNQEGFQSSFDDYVDRYTDDTTLANQQRGDMATAQANATDLLREDIGKYAQAAATGQQDLSKQMALQAADTTAQIGGFQENVGAGMMSLADTMQSGFVDAGSLISEGFDLQSGTMEAGQKDMLLRLSNVQSGLNADIAAAAGEIGNSFDDQGQLIRESTDAQGNTIMRALDAQGNLITKTVDANGQTLDEKQLNMQSALAEISRNVTDRTGNLREDLKTQFADLNRTVGANNEGLMGRMDEIDTNAANRAQAMEKSYGLTTDNVAQLQAQLKKGMQGLTAADVDATKQLAAIASSQGGLSEDMRNQFKSLSTAFDSQGRLISDSIDEQGNVITRQMDAQGNMLLRTFDTQGSEIGQRIFNVNKALFDLSNLSQVDGANVSMGNLSPARKQGATQGGFMAPYTVTG